MIDAELVGWLLASNYRQRVFAIVEKYTLPKDVVNHTSLRFSHVSRTLSELVEMKLIIIENPKANKGRLYTLTDLGVEMKKELDRE